MYQFSLYETFRLSTPVLELQSSVTVFWSRSKYPLSKADIAHLTPHRNSTVGDVARKVMGDVPINYIEGVGGTRVSEEDFVAVGKHDVSASLS